ncbi:XRE family transcriptional regulator [Phyllobacterium brassicacearum]|nr:XRE family transcriptional regulator [Phyllobacterium brassicacearum]
MYADDRLKLQVTARHMNKIELDKQARDNSREIADANPARLGTRLKLARQTRGLTLKALSEAANCSESLLSKIENGKASPSLPMLHRLVQVLETNIGWMFEESDGEEGIVFRAGTRPLIALDPLRRGEGISLERIIPYSQGHLLQCNIHHIEKDGASAGPIQHAGEEVGYVLAGEIELIIGERQFRLAAGDAFVFNSDLPHHYRNIGSERASIFWVNTPPTF